MTETAFKDHFSVQAEDYSVYRPEYPPEMYAWLASLCDEKKLVWDCGTGNGQAAALFAVTPDVTALGAVPCMLLFPRRVRWLFLLLPLIWSLFSVATLWTLGTWVLAVIPGTTLVLAAMACFVSPRQARNPD